ncbi:MAG: calcium/sodium antiporter [Acidobacteriota bacterium]|nr:calcium/sodium antiporter [Acidobacteriota bacterium]MDE3266015.1 calcium/sodium antiporter [Acidobacteriota bacterium]
MISLLLIVLGIAVLWAGGEILVRSVTGLAAVLRVSPTVIGLTVVAFGTSAPELGVAIAAALRDSAGLVYGNVVGSNIANVGLILGISALVVPLHNHSEGAERQAIRLVRRELPFMLATSLLVLTFTAFGRLGRFEGVVLLALMAYFLIVLVRAGDAEPADPQGVSPLKSVLGTVVGLVLLAVGAARLLVPAAQDLALALGVSEKVVGLTVVAFGTSVPELAACLVAAYRNHHGIVLGNIVGSNVFNILLVLPAATLIRPFETTFLAEGLDASVMLFFSLLMFLAVYLLRHGRSIGRTWGALLVAAYGGYVAWLFSKL